MARSAPDRPIPGDRVHLVHDPATGVEAIRARFQAHAYDLHRHDEWLVGVTDYGLQEFLCRGTRQRSTPGRVILIEPQEAHDGQAGTSAGFSYRMLYLPRDWLRAGLGDGSQSDPGFRGSLLDDLPLAGAIRRACTILAEEPSRLARDDALDRVLLHLRAHLGRPEARSPGDRTPLVARRARERLHEAVAENVGAETLARAAGAADRFQLARAFRAAYGTAPHAYLVQLRLLEARRRLGRGEAPASVAAACGFADQSHLGRWFRRAYGLSPAAYRRLCTGVPDRHAHSG